MEKSIKEGIEVINLLEKTMKEILRDNLDVLREISLYCLNDGIDKEEKLGIQKEVDNILDNINFISENGMKAASKIVTPSKITELCDRINGSTDMIICVNNKDYIENNKEKFGNFIKKFEDKGIDVEAGVVVFDNYNELSKYDFDEKIVNFQSLLSSKHHCDFKLRQGSCKEIIVITDKDINKEDEYAIKVLESKLNIEQGNLILICCNQVKRELSQIIEDCQGLYININKTNCKESFEKIYEKIIYDVKANCEYLNRDEIVTVQIGKEEGQTYDFGIYNITTERLKIKKLNILDHTKALRSLNKINKAIEKMNYCITELEASKYNLISIEAGDFGKCMYYA